MSPLHPKGSQGSGLVPATRGTLKPLPQLSPRHRSVLLKHQLPVHEHSSGSPQNTPK